MDNDVLADLVGQLAWFDHENDTDVASELTELIGTVKIHDLDKEEATELFNDRFELMQLESVLVAPEHIKLVETAIQRILAALF